MNRLKLFYGLGPSFFDGKRIDNSSRDPRKKEQKMFEKKKYYRHRH